MAVAAKMIAPVKVYVIVNWENVDAFMDSVVSISFKNLFDAQMFSKKERHMVA